MENHNVNPQNQEGKIIYNNFQKPNYYTTTGKKVGDFILGFFGIIILNSILWVVLYPLLSSRNWGFVNLFIYLIILILLMVLFFKIDRRFIAIGIISVALIPILVFGSCLFLLGGF
ncbi:MAG: hypothetical protein PHR36_01270 [Patescibacteria group bacterium]|nr:hypothetical protein [Patescibacteria group bacterium]